MILIEDLSKVASSSSPVRSTLSVNTLARLAIAKLALKRRRLLDAVEIIQPPRPVSPSTAAELSLISVTVRGDSLNYELVERIRRERHKRETLKCSQEKILD